MYLITRINYKTFVMNKYQDAAIYGPVSDCSAQETVNNNIAKQAINERITAGSVEKDVPAKIATAKSSSKKKWVNQLQTNSECLSKENPENQATSINNNIFRLCIKNGEYVYARANDIIMIESCDHLVKIHLAINDKIKKAVRNNTLKDFLLQLPQGHFIRIGRFCAVNMLRLSGGNCNEQTFEFDFKISVKLRHSISSPLLIL